MPYAYEDYYRFSFYHCRHSAKYHDVIAKLFTDNIDLFQISYVYKDILFTHAGVMNEWLNKIVGYKDEIDVNKISDVLNSLTGSHRGLEKLYCISQSRGGRFIDYGSCIWADANDMLWDAEYGEKPLRDMKQIFGHTLQAYYDKDGKICYGEAIESGNMKMLDTTSAYELDCNNFKITKI